MKGYIQLARPINGFMAAVAVLIAALIASAYNIPQAKHYALYFAIAVVVLFIAAGNALNDYFDRDVDKVNHPKRPIPSGRVKPESALRMAQVLFAISIALSVFVNLEALLLVVANIGIMVSYELKFKNKGLSGNAIISWLTATIFLFGGLAVYGSVEEFLKVSTLALLAFTATLGREIVKDIEDVRGDVRRKTLPKRIGVRYASYISATIFIIIGPLSILPLWLNLFEILYLPFIFLADVIFIYCGILLFQNPRTGSNLAKAGMIVALIAFMAGGIGI